MFSLSCLRSYGSAAPGSPTRLKHAAENVPSNIGVVGAGSYRRPAITDIKHAQVHDRFDLDALRGLDLNQRPLGYEASVWHRATQRSPTRTVA